MEEAFFNELPKNLIDYRLPDQYKGNYSIPPDQRLIDEFFTQAGPNAISGFVADINNDGIYDSALILMGLSKDVDQVELINNINDEIDPYYVDPGVRPGSTPVSFSSRASTPRRSPWSTMAWIVASKWAASRV